MSETAVTPRDLTPTPVPSNSAARPPGLGVGGLAALLLGFVLLNTALSAGACYLILQAVLPPPAPPPTTPPELTKAVALLERLAPKAGDDDPRPRAKKLDKPRFVFSSVAVLPFSGGSEGDKAVKAAAERMATALPKLLERQGLAVIPSEKAAAIQEVKDPRAAGRELKAQTVFTGRFARDDFSYVYLFLELIDVETGLVLLQLEERLGDRTNWEQKLTEKLLEVAARCKELSQGQP